jgi:hypothetical protein
MSIRHLRRLVSRPEGPCRLIRCECGWEGRTPDMGRTEAEVDASLERIYRDHLPVDEARTHLLVDSRENPDFQDLDWWLDQAPRLENGKPDRAWARAHYSAQPRIIGTFVMPIGEPVTLVADRLERGVHFGTYRNAEQELAELPIGEVMTTEGRVFRLDE